MGVLYDLFMMERKRTRVPSISELLNDLKRATQMAQPMPSAVVDDVILLVTSRHYIVLDIHMIFCSAETGLVPIRVR